jgi:hypothetical protein
VPPPTATWHPVGHAQVYDAVTATLTAAGYAVRKADLALARDGNRFFATLDLTAGLDDGVSLAVGVRNSLDKSLPLGFCAGNRVFVCDNLAFSAELAVTRKHTRFGRQRFAEAIDAAVTGLSAFAAAERSRIARLKAAVLGEEKSLALMARAVEAGVVGATHLPALLQEWRTPTHDYGTGMEPTAWLLFNAVTTVLGRRRAVNPNEYAKRTMALNGLLAASVVPADTAPAAGPAPEGR